MARRRSEFACSGCGHRTAKWAGRCPGCGTWGSLTEAAPAGGGGGVTAVPLGTADPPPPRIATGIPGLDRVLGGGLVPASVVLLAGPPGIGKSTLVLHVVAALAAAGSTCLVVSGEESRDQVAARAVRLGVSVQEVRFAPGRDLQQVLGAALSEQPDLLVVDSIQTLRDTAATQLAGGVSQVRMCTDALVGLAKAEGIAVVLTGHVTKEGDLAGPRALEHAVDVVLSFEGDPRSGLRVVTCGKNRFGSEGESAWFEMGPSGLQEIDPTGLLVSDERLAGSAIALPMAGRRALAVQVQALLGSQGGPPRRQTTGLDPRRFQLIAAVLERSLGLPLGRTELYGAVAGGLRLDDPGCDLAIAAALASAATGVPPPAGSAFVGEIALTGQLRPAPGAHQRLRAAAAAGIGTAFVPEGTDRGPSGVRLVRTGSLVQALGWALSPAGTASVARTA